jgi:hypothetical protein
MDSRTLEVREVNSPTRLPVLHMLHEGQKLGDLYALRSVHDACARLRVVVADVFDEITLLLIDELLQEVGAADVAFCQLSNSDCSMDKPKVRDRERRRRICRVKVLDKGNNEEMQGLRPIHHVGLDHDLPVLFRGVVARNVKGSVDVETPGARGVSG